jgi:putative ABC transport system permease protein
MMGRSFTKSDTWDSPRVAVVNQAFVRTIFPGQDVIGKRVHVAPKMDAWVSIVGLVGDDRHGGLAEAVRPQLFTPYEQPVLSNMSTAIAVRTHNDPSELTTLLRHSVSRLDGNQAIYDVATMEERLAATLSDRKLQMLVLLCFAGMALVLGIVGIYGVMSYSVAQRSHEIGVRMALGSGQARVLQMVLTEALMLSLAGVGIGVAGALGVTHFMSSLLYGVTASDPINLICVSLLLITAGALAGYLPARHASQVDPMIVLRRE